MEVGPRMYCHSESDLKIYTLNTFFLHKCSGKKLEASFATEFEYKFISELWQRSNFP